MAASKHEQALDLRVAGASYRQIAATLKMSLSTAHRLCQRALQEAKSDEVAEARTAELMRLDRLLMAVWPRASGGDMDAVDRALRVMDRRAKLLGLDQGAAESKQPAAKPQLVSALDELRAQRERRGTA